MVSSLPYVWSVICMVITRQQNTFETVQRKNCGYTVPECQEGLQIERYTLQSNVNPFISDDSGRKDTEDTFIE